MYSICEIKDYIMFLNDCCGLSVTLHPCGEEHVILPSELISFNIHSDSYCIYVKTFPQARKHCIERQGKILRKCRDGSFCGTCYAGVREYVYPILHGKNIRGFISVSGYKCSESESYLARTAHRFSVPLENLRKVYDSLKGEIPPKEMVDTLIHPLCRMLELAYVQTEGETGEEETLAEQTERYLKEHRSEPITLEDVCRRFVCSRSKISHNFKKQTGYTVREYLTHLRVGDAKILLRHSNLSITEIAFSVGFSDSNYFSSVFKKQVGMSPMAYRKIENA